MDEQEKRQAVALVRQALKPLLKEAISDEFVREYSDQLLEKMDAFTEAVKAVKQEAPDVTVINEAISEMQTLAKRDLTQKLELPAIEKSEYQPHDQGKKGVFKYAGFVRSDGSWYIQRIAKNEQRYASGNGNYLEAWEKCDKQKYGIFSESA